MAQLVHHHADATRPKGDGPRVLAHLVSDTGVWGLGFSGALSARWPTLEKSYRAWHAAGAEQGFRLGGMGLMPLEPQLWLAHLVAEHGLSARHGQSPLDWAAFEDALQQLRTFAQQQQASIHVPRLGAGLCGAPWHEIENCLHRLLVAHDLDVHVYRWP